MTPPIRGSVVQRAYVGHATPEHDRVGIENIDDHGKGFGKPIDIRVQNCTSVRIARRRLGRNLGCGAGNPRGL